MRWKKLVATPFMFELNLIQIFRPRNDIPFCPFFVLYGFISSVICDLVLFSEGINVSLRLDGTGIGKGSKRNKGSA